MQNEKLFLFEKCAKNHEIEFAKIFHPFSGLQDIINYKDIRAHVNKIQ